MRIAHAALREFSDSGVASIAGFSLYSVNWVEQAHGIGDDLSTDEQTMLVELAAVVYDWPVRNPVVEKALREAAIELLALASLAADHHIPHSLPAV